ncbi:MAG TPA: zf-HC2 domain-containing protein [Acetobacteraceae bacterium]|nr:zf-HC2 domain-containing protein [Acetobacteraceae bacterium]
MPACREMSELVTSYLERTLPLGVRLDAGWHLFRCPACRRYYEQMRQTVRLLAGGRLPPPGPAAEAGLLANLADAAGPPPA